MYPIFQNATGEGHSLESFNKRMIEICNEHRKQKRAMAFAFILYDLENAQIAKILADREYWNALNKISGKFLTIFSIYQEKPKRRPPQRYDGSTISMLTMIPSTSNPSDGTNALVKKYFGPNIALTYPAILFFQVGKNTVINSLLIELREEKNEPAFLELKEFIKKAVGALELIQPENKGNLKEIFECLVREVNSARAVKRFWRVARIGVKISEFISDLIF